MESHKNHVAVSDAGISVTGEFKTVEIKWADIQQVIAYKRDVFAVDQICLAIGGIQSAIEVTEDFKGWEELLERAPTYLPGWRRKSDWYDEVVLPPFKAERTLIFSRP